LKEWARTYEEQFQVEEVIMKEFVLAIICAFTTRKNICLYLSLLLLSVTPVEAKDTPPNILYIVVDNQPASISGIMKSMTTPGNTK